MLTGGNHTLQKTEIYPMLESEPRMLRPANIAVRAPGRGLVTVETPAGPVSVVNVLGSVFMTASQSPFAIIDDLVERARAGASHVIVDVHAEATSEKIALGWHLDGRVTAVVGTHTHVQTADARVLPGGTAYLTDLGMTGPHDSVIGVRTEIVLRRFLSGGPGRFEPADDGCWCRARWWTPRRTAARARSRPSASRAEPGGVSRPGSAPRRRNRRRADRPPRVSAPSRAAGRRCWAAASRLPGAR